jgi:hypothetical protein
MLRSILLLSCLILTGSALLQTAPQQDEQAHKQWLAERYKEAASIKEGMTFAELYKSFEPDGGLQLMLPERYVLRSCSMIKVDVQFDLPEGEGHKILPEGLRAELTNDSHASFFSGFKIIPDTELKIKSISRPYLEPYALD